ncbi:MAG: hypothetical protein ACUVRG_01330 [Ignavibacterium sp.]|uniref:hypothetical protein n=1 Tax=Ignavibacterium sp. TaxID=2651167 RepID=UPI00404A7FCA
MNKYFLKITKNNFENSDQKRSVEIFSWKRIKEHPFELFKSDVLIFNSLLDKSNMDYKEDWAMEYEMTYNSQLLGT